MYIVFVNSRGLELKMDIESVRGYTIVDIMAMAREMNMLKVKFKLKR